MARIVSLVKAGKQPAKMDKKKAKVLIVESFVFGSRLCFGELRAARAARFDECDLTSCAPRARRDSMI